MITNNNYMLEELSFLAGDFFTIEFSVFDEALGQLADLSAYTVSCIISVLGKPNEIVLSKEGIKSAETGKYTVEFNSNETLNLSGKYVYQPLIYASETRQYRPAQGILTIIPAIT